MVIIIRAGNLSGLITLAIIAMNAYSHANDNDNDNNNDSNNDINNSDSCKTIVINNDIIVIVIDYNINNSD